MKKWILFLALLFEFAICSAAHGAPTRNGPPLTCEGNTSGCKISIPVAASGDIVWCGLNPIYGSSAGCSCVGGTPHAMDSQPFTSPAATAFVLQMALTGCAVGTDVITVTSSGSTIQGTTVDVTGNPAIDVFTMSLPMSVTVGNAALIGPIVTTSNDYCLSLATDAVGNGGNPQVPVAPFVAEGTPKDAYPENFADFTQTSAGSISASWNYTNPTPAAVMMLACFKTAPLVTNFRVCSLSGPCIDLPPGASTFSFTVYIVSNGTQSPPVAVDSITIMPSQ